MYIDRYTPVRGGRWSDRLRRLSIWSIVSNYFPIKLIKTEDLDPNRNYIFGYHPHGAATVGAGISFLTEATHFSTLFPGIRPHLMALHSNFFCPFLRELFLSLGKNNIINPSSNVLLF
jgi:2-acylglycerol O-acyltransferase 2